MAELDITLRLSLRGRYYKGDRSVGEGDGFEDIDIEDACIVRTRYDAKAPQGQRFREEKHRIRLPVEVRNAILEALDQTILQDTLREDLDF